MLCEEVVWWWKPTPPSVPQTPTQVPVPCANSVTLVESPPTPGMAKWKETKGAVGREGAGSMPV